MSKYQDMLLGGSAAGGAMETAETRSPAGSPRSTPAAGSRYQGMLFGTSPAPAEAAPDPARETSGMGDFFRGLGDTAMFGFADEAEAGIRSLLGGEGYDAELERVRGYHENASPAWYGGAFTGLAVPGLGIGGLAARGATKGARLALAGAGGAAEGGLAAAGGADGSLAERAAAVPMGVAVGGAAGLAGGAIGEKLVSRLERRLAEDIERLDDLETSRLRGLAEDQGITLTPAELTNLPSLKQEQKRIGQFAQTGDDLADFYRNRNADQIDPAIERFLGGISDIEGDEVAGDLARSAANRASDAVASNRASQASPLYQKAFDEAAPVDTAPILAKIDEIGRTAPEGGEVSRALGKARRLLGKNTDLPTLHGVKLELDQMISAANPTKALGNTTKAKVLDVQKALVSALDEASPDYRDARAVFADLSPGVQRVREGIVGTIADLPDQQLRTAAARLFAKGRISVRSAEEAKRQLQGADPDAWQAIKRAFIEEQWLKASKEMVDGDAPNRGAKFKQALLGDQKQRQILQATMEPDEFQALTDLGDVLEASGRVKRVGSDTAMNQEANRLARDKAAPMLAKVLSVMNTDALPEIARRWTERRLISNSRETLAAITSPDGIQLMKELKRAKPSERMSRAIMGQWISQNAAEPIAAAPSAGQRAVVEDEEAPPEPMAFDFQRDAEGNIIGATRR